MNHVFFFRESLTIASHAVKHYKTNYLPDMEDKLIAKVPPTGYWRNEQQSEAGKAWLKYMAEKVRPLSTLIAFPTTQI